MPISVEKNIRSLTEIEFFRDQNARTYFELWCQASDEVLPIFLSRDEWETMMVDHEMLGMTGERPTLYLPDDLKLWEMLAVVNWLDQTLLAGGDREPARAERQRLRQVVQLFRQTGFYLKEYAGAIDWAGDEKEGNETQELIEGFAAEFYQFGRSLLKGRKVERTFTDIPDQELTADQKLEVEKWLMGPGFMKKRLDRLALKLGREPNPTEIEAERQRLVEVFFRAISRDFRKNFDFSDLEPAPAETATQAWNEYFDLYLGLTDEEAGSQLPKKQRLEKQFIVAKPWATTTPNLALQLSVSMGLKQIFAWPRAELERAIFARGTRHLYQTLSAQPAPAASFEAITENLAPKPVDDIDRLELEQVKAQDDAFFDFLEEAVDLSVAERRQLLEEKIDVPRLKRELVELRNSGAEVDAMTAKELEIVHLIQTEVSHFTYSEGSSMPTDVMRTQKLNCVGVTLVSGLILNELGIKYLAARVPGHSVIIVITADGELHFRDMAFARNNLKIGDNEIAPAERARIKEFSRHPQNRSLQTKTSLEWQYNIIQDEDVMDPALELYHPQVGLQAMVMDNFAHALDDEIRLKNRQPEEMIVALERYLDQVPNDSMMLIFLAEYYIDAGRTEEATLLLWYITELIPSRWELFATWGKLLLELGKFELAIEALRQSLVLDPGNELVWLEYVVCLGELDRTEEMLEVCEQAQEFVSPITFVRCRVDYFVEMGEWNRAIAEFRRLTAEVPDDEEVWAEYFMLLFRADPHDEKKYQQSCRAFVQLEDWEGLKEVMELALAENPNETWPLQLISNYQGMLMGQSGFEFDAES